ncbi:flagellar hook-associated protein FlgL [Sporosarcina contaminans]|uniref:Flagellar hook-associated protein FlgL n=1 Tax=Sporosarcina contaminans TaxID=633403 RepID=A0ABW3TVV1_9BACL
MRVTQSMLSNNMLRNLSNSYSKMGRLQDQLTTQKKVNRPSDDPVVAMKGMAFRMQVDKVEQYQRNLGEVHNWLDTSDDALDQVGEALKRLQELVVDASNDTKTQDDREKILEEIKQLRTQIQDLANTKVGDKHLFSGTNTGTPLFVDGEMVDPADYPGLGNDVTIGVFDGVQLKVNTNGNELFSNIDEMMESIINKIDKLNADGTPADDPTGEEISSFLTDIDKQQNAVLEARADIGARQNRAEMMEHRLDTQEVISKKQMSENEDIDIEQVITEMITQESVHRVALSVGARIIQPSLVDFLR